MLLSAHTLSEQLFFFLLLFIIGKKFSCGKDHVCWHWLVELESELLFHGVKCVCAEVPTHCSAALGV